MQNVKTFDSKFLTNENNKVKEVEATRTRNDLWGMTKINLPNGLVIHIRNDNGYGDDEGINTESSTQVYIEDKKNDVTFNLATINQQEPFGDRGELINEVSVTTPVGKISKWADGEKRNSISFGFLNY